jgi:uncharacterized protein
MDARHLLDRADRRRGRWGVVRSITVAAAALLLAALLDAEALEDTASNQPFGWRHDVATAVADPLVRVSRALHLTAPRRWLEDAFDRPSTQPDVTPMPATTTTTVPPSTTGPGSGSTTTTAPPTTTVPQRRRPTAADPLRLLMAGDSMTEAAGPALLDASERTGVIDASHELRYSSGLTRPDYFDWPARLATLLAEQDPEAVVVFLGANDAQGIQTPSGPVSFGTDAWVAEYRARVAAVMDLLTAEGRTVYWIGQPVMREGGYDERMRLLTRIYREEAEGRADVRFLDTRATFTGPDGGYSAYLADAAGRPVLVRRDDGIHLTPAGADRLIALVMRAIDTDWSVGSA